MRIRPILPIGLAALLILGLCTVLTGRAASAADYTLATADGLALTLSADGQVTSLQIDGQELVSTPAPALVLRDLSHAGQVTEPNLVTNPGFEEGLSGWTEIVNRGLEVSIVVSPAHSGDKALELANPLTDTYRFAAYASDPLSVTPGQRYRFSAWFRSETGYVTRPSGSPVMWQKDLWRDPPRTNALYVQWFDADGQSLGDPQLAAPLHWNAAHWRLIRRELTAPPRAAQARVVIGALLAGQILWVDDVAFVYTPEPDIPLTGTVGPCPQSPISNLRSPSPSSRAPDGCLTQTIPLPESGLTLTLTYTAEADHIAIRGDVVDTTGQDRAVDVSWAVPFDPVIGLRAEQAQGGPLRLWWDDAHSSRQITQPVPYANAISAIYDGWLPISLYPYAGVQISSKGVAIGLPLNRPQLAVLSYDGASGRYGATFHLGISPRAVKVGPRAGFDLLLYRFDPDWGFRDVIARHRAIQPEAYTTDLPIYDYAGFEQGWYFTASGVQEALAHDAANVYSAQYTGSELALNIAPSSEPRPILDQVLEVVSEMLDSPLPWDAALARAMTQSAVVDTNGDWSLKHIGVFSWAPDWWQAAWAANLDPDLEDGLASWTLDWRITPAFTMTTQAGAHLDGVQIDNFMSTPTFDLRPEALAAADWPLGYTPHTYQPAVHNGFAFREYLAFLRDYLDTEWGSDRGITINFWGLGHPNHLAEYIDGFGSEGNLKGNGEGPNWNPEVLDYRRAIACSRPYMFANQMTGLTASEAYTFTQMALLYGVGTGPGPNAGGWEPEAQQIISDTAALITRYWAAGWQPLTYARADSEDVWIERFGGPETPETEDALYFTVHNRTDLTRTATITVETSPLGLTDPTSATITDLASEETLPSRVMNGDIVVSLTLGPLQTRVLRVSGGVAPPTPTPTPTPSPTATPSPSQCVGDVNNNGIGDVVDIQTTAAELDCVQYLPIVVANWHQPWPTVTPTPAPGVTLRSDLTQAGSPLPALLKPSANLHPMWGDRNEAPIAWWQEQVPRWQEGTYFFDLDLFHIERGDIDLAHGRYPDALVRFAGPPANALIDIDRVPASLEPPECLQEENYPRHQDTARCAPTSYEAYQKVLEALLVYLSVPDVVMPDNQATRILGIAGQPSLGLDGLRYIFWHEANSVGWWDTTAAWFKLYDYWIAAVRNVRNTYPGVNFKVGTEFMGDNRLVTYEGWQRNHEDLLNYLDLFLSFLNGNPPKGHEDYQYRAQPPLDLEFYAFNPRNNLNDHWINDWPDGFYREIQDRFAQYGFGDVTYVTWALESGHTQVNAPVLAGSEPDRRYIGAERDSEMGAAAQIALQYDVERSPVIPISSAWAEFFSDAGEDVNDFLPWDFPLYCGATGNAFTYAYYAKPTYNVMRMLGMQETTRVPAEITDTVSPPKRDYVGAVVTRDDTGQHAVVLLWYYIPPEDLASVAGQRYEDLRAYADAHLRTDLEVALDGLGEGPYRLERYLVDETHSNGFHYRQQIADAKVPAAEVNGWLPGNNPYDASVALEQVEARDGVSPAGGTLRLHYTGVAPWTVMLIELRAD